MEVSEVVTTTTVQSAAVALNNPLNEVNDTPDDLYSYIISENTGKQIQICLKKLTLICQEQKQTSTFVSVSKVVACIY